jgi:pyrimidine-specific ribonucleoside hydrolase
MSTGNSSAAERTDMIRKTAHLSLLLLVLLWVGGVFVRGEGTPLCLIVDTDMALDDVRALALLVASPDVRIYLVATSDGACSPETGCDLATGVMAYFGRTNVPVAAGRNLGQPGPEWRDWSERLQWPAGFVPPAPRRIRPPAADLIAKTVRRLDGRVVYLCLGPMTNLADALRHDPGIRSRIDRVVYYGSAPSDPVQDWNTRRDLHAAVEVFRSGLKIETLWQPEDRLIPFDAAWLERIRQSSTPPARLIVSTHSAPAVQTHLQKGGMKIWDELAALYLVDPQGFTFVPRQGAPTLRRLEAFQTAEVRAVYLKLLGVNPP